MKQQFACSYFLLQIGTSKSIRWIAHLKGGCHLHFHLQELPRFCLLKHPIISGSYLPSAVLPCIEMEGCRDSWEQQGDCVFLVRPWVQGVCLFCRLKLRPREGDASSSGKDTEFVSCSGYSSLPDSSPLSLTSLPTWAFPGWDVCLPAL